MQKKTNLAKLICIYFPGTRGEKQTNISHLNHCRNRWHNVSPQKYSLTKQDSQFETSFYNIDHSIGGIGTVLNFFRPQCLQVFGISRFLPSWLPFHQTWFRHFQAALQVFSDTFAGTWDSNPPPLLPPRALLQASTQWELLPKSVHREGGNQNQNSWM